jgi:hypothetical protein
MAYSKIAAATALGAVALGSILVSPVAADAAPSTASAFITQSRAAGLSPALADAVQSKVDGYLATVGGKQIAPNKIQLDNATITVTVPGESRTRDLTGSGLKPAAAYCALHYMCAYQGVNYTGDEVDMYACKRYYFSTWSGPGSWYNNQTKGTVAYMYGPTGALVYKTPPAPSGDTHGDWSPIHSIINC